MDARLASGAQCSASRPLLAPKAAVRAAASWSTSGLTSPSQAWCLTGRRLRALHTVCMVRTHDPSPARALWQTTGS